MEYSLINNNKKPSAGFDHMKMTWRSVRIL